MRSGQIDRQFHQSQGRRRGLPHARAQSHFGVGKIDRDQAMSYAQRKGLALAEAERWLAPNLGYDADAGAAVDAA